MFVSSGQVVAVSSGQTASDAVVGTEQILSGGIASGTVVSSGGELVILPGGTASGTIVLSGGHEIVEGGAATRSVIVGGGEQDIASGGTTFATTLSGGIQDVGSGGVAVGTTLALGGPNFGPEAVQNVLSGGIASNTLVNGAVGHGLFGELNVASGGSAVSAMLVSGGLLVVSGTAIDTTIVNGGETTFGATNISGTIVSSGGSLYTLVVSSGTVFAPSGSDFVLDGVTVESGAAFDLDVVGSAVGVSLGSNDREDVYAGGVATLNTVRGFQYIESGGTATDSEVLSGGFQGVYSGSIVAETTVSSGGVEFIDFGSSDFGDNVYGSQWVVSSGVADAPVIAAGGIESVSAGGSAIGAAIDSGGLQSVLSGGLARSSLVAGGGVETVSSGGLDIGATLAGGDQEIMAGGSATSVSVGSGSVQFVASGGFASATLVVNGGVQTVASGGDAVGVTVASGGEVLISSGGIWNGMAIGAGGATILNSGGTTYLSSGGAVTNYDYGVPSGGVVSGGEMIVSGGEIVSGTIVSAGFIGIISSGTTIGTILRGGIENVDFGGTASGTIVSSGSEEVVGYGGAAYGTVVSSGGSAFIGDFTGLGGTASGFTVSSGGALYIEMGATIGSGAIASGGTVGGLVVSSGSTVSGQPSGGFVAEGVTVASGAIFNLGVFGSATNILIGSGGSVYDDGMVSNLTVGSGGFLLLPLSGSVTGVVVESGGRVNGSFLPHGSSVDVGPSGEFVANGITVESGGVLQDFSILGSIAGVQIVSGGDIRIAPGGALMAATISSGGIALVSSGGVASGTVVSSGGELLILPGGTGSGTIVLSGGQEIVEGGTSIAATVGNQGELEVQSGGTASNTTVQSGGFELVSSGGTAFDALVLSGGVEGVRSGGASISALVSGGAEYAYGMASGTVLIGGFLYVDMGGTTSGAVIKGGGEEIIEGGGGTATDTTISGGGISLVSGTAIGVTISSGSLGLGAGMVIGATITSGSLSVGGGTAIGVILSSGSQFTIEGGVAISTTVSNGASGTVFSGGSISGTTISSGSYVDVYSGGIAADTVVSSGAALDAFAGSISLSGGTVSSGGFIDGLVVSSGSSFTAPAGDFVLDGITIKSGGIYGLDVYGTARGVAVGQGAVMEVFAGGTAISASLGSSGVQEDYGATSGTQIESGGAEFIYDVASATAVGSGGVDITFGPSAVVSGSIVESGGAEDLIEGTSYDTLVSGGGLQYVFGGIASGTVVLSGGAQIVATQASGTVVGSGGYLVLLPGSTASGTIGAGDIVSTGVVLNVPGQTSVFNGTAENLVADHGLLLVLSNGTAVDAIFEAGIAQVWSGGIASGAVVGSGSLMQVLSGGIAVGTIIGSGGREEADEGVASATVISGGELVINGGDVVGGVAFAAGTSGTLDLSGGPFPTGAISGFAQGDAINVLGATRATFTPESVSGGVLSVFDGASVLGTFALVGDYSHDAIVMNSEGLSVASAAIGTGAGLFGGGADAYLRDPTTGQLSVEETLGGGSTVETVALTQGGSAFVVDGNTTAFGVGGEDRFFLRLGTGQIEAVTVDQTGAVLGTLAFVQPGGAPATIDPVTTIVGTGLDYFGTGQDIFLRSGTGQLEAEEFNAGGTLLTGIGFTSGGSAFAVAADTTVIGAAQNYLGGGSDVFLRLANGQLQVAEFAVTGAETSGLALTVSGGAPAVPDAATNVVGVSQNYFGTGSDVFLRSGAGQLEAEEFTAAGTLITGIGFTNGGAAETIAAGTTVVGTARNYLGSGSDVFLRSSAGQLSVAEFNAGGALTGSLALAVSGGGSALPDGATTVVGVSQNYFGTGSDVFLRTGTGQLEAEEFTVSGTLITGIGFTSVGSAFTIATGASVIGTAANYLGGGSDVFERSSAGQLSVAEFNAGGTQTGSLVLAVSGGGSALPDGTTTVVGVAQNYFGTGSDVFFRTGTGQLEAEEFNAGGTLITGIGFTSGGSAFTIAAGTTVIGTGQDYIGSGSDIFLRLATGQLVVDEFGATGALAATQSLTVSGGAASTVDGATSVVGTGSNYFGAGSDIFFRTGTGQLEVEEYNASGTLITGIGFTSGGAAFTIAPSATVVGEGTDFLGAGKDVFLRLGTGQLVADVSDGTGALVASHALTMSGSLASTIDGATKVIGTGQDFFAGTGFPGTISLSNDVFFRNGSGQLEVEGYDSSGNLLMGVGLTNGDASALIVAPTTSAVGSGIGAIGSGHDVFLRLGTGQLVIDEFGPSAGPVTLSATLSLTLGGAPFTIDGETSVIGVGQDYFATGTDAYLRGGNGAIGVVEFNSGGTVTVFGGLPALGDGDSAQTQIGTSGADVLRAQTGASTLIGDGGTDTYIFGAGDTSAVIVNGTHGGAAAGELKLTTPNLTDANIWFDRVNDTGAVSSSGNNLKVELLGTSNAVTIDGWFAQASSRLSDVTLQTIAGGTIDSQIANLVQAMASYETAHPGFDVTNPANGTITDSTLLATVNASWHN